MIYRDYSAHFIETQADYLTKLIESLNHRLTLCNDIIASQNDLINSMKDANNLKDDYIVKLTEEMQTIQIQTDDQTIAADDNLDMSDSNELDMLFPATDEALKSSLSAFSDDELREHLQFNIEGNFPSEDASTEPVIP